ncbi:MAG: hypothetical protein ABL967_10780 [Bryobacteraceae bacterium]
MRLVFERVDEEMGVLRYEKPKILRVAGNIVMDLPIVLDGTGVGNESEYYLREKGAWARIESESWRVELLRKIPSGLQIRKGIWPDFEAMTAEIALYRDGDANCCPSGGSAVAHLSLRAKRLALTSVDIETNR